jgi:hypothetical protein
MHEFRDNKGRPWQLELNVDVLEQIKTECGSNLLDLADPDSDLIREVIAFPPLIAKLVFAALAEQAKLKEVDAREFRRSMNGESLQAAHDALLDEIILFCPPGRRSLLQAVRDKNREVEEAGVSLAMTRLNDPELTHKALAAMDRQVSQRIQEALQNLDTTTPVADNPSATGFSTSVGQPPVFSVFPAPDHTPGDSSKNSPMELGSPTAT